MKTRIKHTIEKANEEGLSKTIELLKDSKKPIWTQKTAKKTLAAYFIMDSAWPIWFYFTYIYCGDLLKNNFGFSGEQVIQHNFKVSVIQLLSTIFIAIMSSRIYPLKIIRIQFYAFIACCCASLLVLSNLNNPFEVLLMQSFFICCAPTVFPAHPIIYIHFPIYKRFTYTSLIHALSRALMYIIASFGMIYLIDYLGYWGLCVMIVPSIFIFAWSLSHFEELEKRCDHYPETTSPLMKMLLPR